MGNVADEIMPDAAMKAALKAAKTVGTRVPVAVALDEDGKAAVLVAKKGTAKSARLAFAGVVKKKKLDGSIKTDAQHLFFGYGTTDPGAEAILNLALNKAPPGGDTFATKILGRVRGAGFAKVVLTSDNSLENEAEEPAGVIDTAPTNEGDETKAAQKRLQNAATLKKLLADQMQRIGTVANGNDTLRKTCLALATDGNEALKRDDLMVAATAVAQLKNALDTAETTTPGLVDFNKPRLVWQATRNKARGETDRLRAKLVEHYQPQGIDKAIVAAYNGLVERVFSEFDDSLADTLDAAGSARQAEERSKLVQKAKDIIGSYQDSLSKPPMTFLENNPFEKLALGEMLGNSLKELSAALK